MLFGKKMKIFLIPKNDTVKNDTIKNDTIPADEKPVKVIVKKSAIAKGSPYKK